MNRIPVATPKPTYAAFATLTRHLNRKNFDGWLPTGSGSVYALAFKHYKTGALTHVLWTIRGTRELTMAAPAGAKVTVHDHMDNVTALPVKDGRVSFAISPAPRFVTGLGERPAISLGPWPHLPARR
jgi:hypothetical protein